MTDSASANQKQHIAGRISFLVCVSHDNSSTVAARFAALRAQNSGGNVALLHVTQPPEFQHWAAVGKRMREEMHANAEELLSGVKDEISDLLNTKPSLDIREGRIGDEILNFVDEKEMNEGSKNQGDKDELYQSALDIIKSEGKASTSFLQRKLQIGYNRAARIIDMMEAEGIVSKANHVGKRDVL